MKPHPTLFFSFSLSLWYTHTHTHTHLPYLLGSIQTDVGVHRTRNVSLRGAHLCIPPPTEEKTKRSQKNPAKKMEDYEDYSYHDNTSDNDSYEDYHTVCEKHDVRSFAGAFLPVVYSISFVIGVAGNAMVVAVYAYHKRLKTMTDAFVVHLAVADLLLLFTLPFWAVDAARGWQVGAVLCKLVSALYTINFTCSMLLLACISVDRYLAITAVGRDRGQGRGFRPSYCSRVCLLCWVAAFTLGVPDLVFSTVVSTVSGRTACLAVYSHEMVPVTRACLEVAEVLLGFLLPLTVMLFCYSRVVCTIGVLPLERRGRKWKVIRVLLAVVGVFVITQLPYNVVKFCRAMDSAYALVSHCEVSKALDRAAQVTESLALTHCCLNPVLYAFIGSSFRQHVLKFAKGLEERRRRRRRTGSIETEQGVDIDLNSHAGSQETSTFSI
ncbi:atypical chemokine receptor 4 isoform X2 [Clupea harengus]|uniref:Atypical chemokine receptor 4 isoform X2 n=1 Tax=Clupea harengus TaxID=7950 RepID=A0A6P8F6Z7_CLUHA|nr:atypical chemokine receptor 4 isoform X2 [Clupea harengus]